MKKLIALVFISTFSTASWADAETLEYCKHKYEQVTMDVAYERLGCNFSKSTLESILQNRENTFMNCKDHLDDESRNLIGKQSLALAKVMIGKLGVEAACESNANLYPSQTYN